MSLTQSVIQTSSGHRASGRDPRSSSRCFWRDAVHSQHLPALYKATDFWCCFTKRKHDEPFFLLSPPRNSVKYSYRSKHTHTLKCSAGRWQPAHCLPSLEWAQASNTPMSRTPEVKHEETCIKASILSVHKEPFPIPKVLLVISTLPSPRRALSWESSPSSLADGCRLPASHQHLHLNRS